MKGLPVMKQRRNTRQRQLVLDAVLARRDHPTAEQIYRDVQSVDGRISRGTVYRNLNVLARQVEILPVKSPHADRFEARNKDHYHLLCTQCGAVTDAPLPYIEELDRETAEKTGFTIKSHNTIFEGTCPDCQKKNP